ncbi:MAG: hypothetical protein KDI36_00530 [Pseudomonadales bacterium]|nr:hypothetical protein [Pseudomonadales bacterium]
MRLEKRGDQSLYNYALLKLQLINDLPFEKIDVTDLDSNDAATAIANRITDAG